MFYGSNKLFMNKKAVTEITSFIFLTLLVVTMSLLAYYILTGILENKVSEFDRNNMEDLLNKLDYKLTKLQSFENSSLSFPINFRSGTLVFSGNQIRYNSLISYENEEDYCFSDLCYVSTNGFETIYFNLSNSYIFNSNFSLVSGTYNLFFINSKNDGEIKVVIR